MDKTHKRFMVRLKVLRGQRGLTQEMLAKKAGLTREYLARLETGRHDPPLSTLTRLARALRTDIRELLREPSMSNDAKVSAKTTRVKFVLKQIFPSHEHLSIELVRLMTATDDARHLQKRLLIADESLEGANDTEVSILNGEILHFFRLLCSHLYEAGNALRAVERKRPGLLDTAVAGNKQGKRDLRYVRRAYAAEPEGAFHHSFLKVIRDRVGFHYKEEPLRQSLEKANTTRSLEGTLILAEFAGLSRYTVSDHLTLGVIQDVLGGDLDQFRRRFSKKMEHVIKLAGALGQVVDHLLVHVFDRSPTAILEEREGTVTIPPPVRHAREQVENMRRAQRSD